MRKQNKQDITELDKNSYKLYSVSTPILIQADNNEVSGNFTQTIHFYSLRFSMQPLPNSYTEHLGQLIVNNDNQVKGKNDTNVYLYTHKFSDLDIKIRFHDRGSYLSLPSSPSISINYCTAGQNMIQTLTHHEIKNLGSIFNYNKNISFTIDDKQASNELYFPLSSMQSNNNKVGKDFNQTIHHYGFMPNIQEIIYHSKNKKSERTLLKNEIIFKPIFQASYNKIDGNLKQILYYYDIIMSPQDIMTIEPKLDNKTFSKETQTTNNSLHSENNNIKSPSFFSYTITNFSTLFKAIRDEKISVNSSSNEEENLQIKPKILKK